MKKILLAICLAAGIGFWAAGSAFAVPPFDFVPGLGLGTACDTPAGLHNPNCTGGGGGNNNANKDGQQQKQAKKKSNAKVGKAIVACIAMAVVSNVVEVQRVGNNPADARDLTGREAAVSFARGCPPLFFLVLLFPPDNAGTYQVARLANAWRKSPQGQMITQICFRGGADGCADNGLGRFAVAQSYAYKNGVMPKSFGTDIKLVKKGG